MVLDSLGQADSLEEAVFACQDVFMRLVDDQFKSLQGDSDEEFSRLPWCGSDLESYLPNKNMMALCWSDIIGVESLIEVSWKRF